jgi:hypothetical protein
VTAFYERGVGFRPCTQSDAARLSWTDPEIRAKRVAGMVAAWDDPLCYVLRSRNRSPEEKRTQTRERQRRWYARHRKRQS